MNTLKKKLFIVLSSVVAIVAVALAAFLGTQNTRVTEVHAEGEHTHCVCGGKMSDEAKAASGHVCDDTQVWKAWDGTTGNIPTTAGDHYLYLT